MHQGVVTTAEAHLLWGKARIKLFGATGLFLNDLPLILQFSRSLQMKGELGEPEAVFHWR